MSYLILVRHGKSEWNAKSLWTGLTDVGLVEEGHEEARQAAEAMKDLPIDKVFVSALKRTHETFETIKKTLGRDDLQPTVSTALNERDYGVFTGKNKWEICDEVGEDEFHGIRRGWDVEIPEGESLKAVYERVVPYFEEHIKPELMKGQNVLIVAHGNSLRALEKHLDNLDDVAICNLEIPTGEVHCYTINAAGEVEAKEIKTAKDV